APHLLDAALGSRCQPPRPPADRWALFAGQYPGVHPGGVSPGLPSSVEVAAPSGGVSRYGKRRPQSPSGHDDGSKGTRLALGKPKRVARLLAGPPFLERSPRNRVSAPKGYFKSPAATTGFSRAPMPSISATSVSPGLRNRGGT